MLVPFQTINTPNIANNIDNISSPVIALPVENIASDVVIGEPSIKITEAVETLRYFKPLYQVVT